MLLNDTLSHEHLNYSSFMNDDIPSPSFFISKTDHNINMFLKKRYYLSNTYGGLNKQMLQ